MDPLPKNYPTQNGDFKGVFGRYFGSTEEYEWGPGLFGGGGQGVRKYFLPGCKYFVFEFFRDFNSIPFQIFGIFHLPKISSQYKIQISYIFGYNSPIISRNLMILPPIFGFFQEFHFFPGIFKKIPGCTATLQPGISCPGGGSSALW